MDYDLNITTTAHLEKFAMGIEAARAMEKEMRNRFLPDLAALIVKARKAGDTAGLEGCL